MANSHILLLGRSASSQFRVQLFAARTALGYSEVKLVRGLLKISDDKKAVQVFKLKSRFYLSGLKRLDVRIVC